MTSFLEPDFEPPVEREGFRVRRARLGRQAGAERLGASLFEIEPGNAPFPLHFHLGNEELLIVLSGSTALRTSAGERELDEGEVVSLPAGEEGIHQVINRGREPARHPDRQRDERSRRRCAARVGQAERLRCPAGERSTVSTTPTTVATRSSSGTASPRPRRR